MEPLLVIAGPTASGKSALALSIARATGGEIVSCDSLQLYCGFDIGTAKPSKDELEAAPHHLIDVVDPAVEFSAGDYVKLARKTLQDIASRRHLPIVAGGAGFYLRALLEGLPVSPTRDESLRRVLSQREEAKPGFLHRWLRRLDPARAARIHPNDLHKVIRAIEICVRSGRPSSQLQPQAEDCLDTFRALKIALDPPRALLHARIAARTRQMYERGLVEEVARLLASGLSPRAKPFESVGYKEALACVEDRLTAEEAEALTLIATRQYAKRQLTWFRKERDAVWVQGFGDDPAVAAAVRDRVIRFLEESARRRSTG